MSLAILFLKYACPHEIIYEPANNKGKRGKKKLLKELN